MSWTEYFQETFDADGDPLVEPKIVQAGFGGNRVLNAPRPVRPTGPRPHGGAPGQWSGMFHNGASGSGLWRGVSGYPRGRFDHRNCDAKHHWGDLIHATLRRPGCRPAGVSSALLSFLNYLAYRRDLSPPALHRLSSTTRKGQGQSSLVTRPRTRGD